MKLAITLLLAAAVSATAVAPAGAATTKLADLHAETAVRSFGGVQAWSDYDPATNLWRVQVRRDGQLYTPPIPPSRNRIDVDVGPRSDGVPTLVHVDCPHACRVVVTRLDGGTPQTVPASSGASDPTIYGRQVAWVRNDKAIVTSTWTGHGRRVLAGAPTRKCYKPFTGKPRRCERPSNPRIGDIELHGSQLALVDTFGLKEAGGNGVAEVRTESIKGGAQKLVALMTIGEGGQTWVGPSWAKGKLYFYKACLGDPGGCFGPGAGAFAWNPAHNSYELARSSTPLSGFAIDDDGSHAYEALGPGGPPCGDPDARPCELRVTDPLVFKAVRSQVREP
jgi:hypothetical protein